MSSASAVKLRRSSSARAIQVRIVPESIVSMGTRIQQFSKSCQGVLQKVAGGTRLLVPARQRVRERSLYGGSNEADHAARSSDGKRSLPTAWSCYRRFWAHEDMNAF